MTDSEFSDFKMFDKAPYELPELRTFTEMAIGGIREVEKMYGPVFTVKYIEYALWFIAQKTGEEPPNDIKTLDKLVEYLISISDKYPTPYCACTYAQVKTENLFQGRAGAGTRVAARGITAPVFSNIYREERHFDVDDALSKIRQIGVTMKVIPSEMGYRKNEDQSVDILLPKCPFRDGCKSASEENLLRRLDSRATCVIGEGLCRYFKMLTGSEWDYDVLEFGKPHCIVRCFVV